MNNKTVVMCVCHRITFEELHEYAEKHNLTDVQELIERNMCCCGCGMCYPYVCKMMRTGEAAFAPGDVY